MVAGSVGSSLFFRREEEALSVKVWGHRPFTEDKGFEAILSCFILLVEFNQMPSAPFGLGTSSVISSNDFQWN